MADDCLPDDPAGDSRSDGSIFSDDLPANVVRGYATMHQWERDRHDYSGETVYALANEVLRLRAQADIHLRDSTEPLAGLPGAYQEEPSGPARRFAVSATNGDVYARHPAGPWLRNGVVTISDTRWVSLLDALEEAASATPRLSERFDIEHQRHLQHLSQPDTASSGSGRPHGITSR